MNILRATQNVTGPTLTIPLPPEIEGREVEVEVRVLADKEPWGEGLKRCAERSPMIPNGMTSWMRFTRRESWNGESSRGMNEAFAPRASTSGRHNPAGSLLGTLV